MDHYCPWMFNTVGWANYRYFVLFLFYVTVGCFYGVLLTLPDFAKLAGLPYLSSDFRGARLAAQTHTAGPRCPRRASREELEWCGARLPPQTHTVVVRVSWVGGAPRSDVFRRSCSRSCWRSPWASRSHCYLAGTCTCS